MPRDPTPLKLPQIPIPRAYITHPLGEKHNGHHRQNHLANALTWFRWIFDVTGWPTEAPWITYAMTVDEEILRPKVLAHVAILQSCANVIIACGGQISPHMEQDRLRAERRKIPWVDLSILGYEPPNDRSGMWAEYIRELATLPIGGATSE